YARIKALSDWLNADTGILIVPVAALKRMLPPQSYWETYKLYLNVEEEIDVDKTLMTFVDLGYERVDMVTSPGEFSVRGGIIDIFPVIESYPIRIELFDNE